MARNSTRSGHLQLGFLAAFLIEILRSEPALETGPDALPVLVQRGEPGGIPVAALDDQVLAENALEGEAEPQRRRPESIRTAQPAH